MAKKSIALIGGVGLGIVAIGAVAGGTIWPHSAGDVPSVQGVPTITEGSQIVSPLDAYVPSGEEIRTLEHGVYAATAVCMSNFGFTYDAPPWYLGESGMFPMENGVVSHDRLYGLIDMTQAQRSGYHPDLIPSEIARSEAEQSWQREHDRLFSHSRDYLNVLGAEFGGGTYGGQKIPEGGCYAQGQRQIYGSQIELVHWYETIGGQSWQSASRDDRVRNVFEKWSACMAAAGFDYDTPWTANNEAGPDVTEAEIATAVADVRCKQQENVVGIYAAVDAAYQRLLIDKYGNELDAAVAAFQTSVDKAETLIVGE